MENTPACRPKRILFVIRGKLGDSLLAFATVQAWRAAHPQDEIVLLARKAYAKLLAEDATRLNIRLIPLGGRADLFWRLLYLRFQRFDALAVIWGFGKPVERLGRWVRAERKVYLDRRFSGVFTGTLDSMPFGPRAGPAWQVARLLDPALPEPMALELECLGRRRMAQSRDDVRAPVGLAPLADEARRSASLEVVQVWLQALERDFPGCPVQLLLNPGDPGARPLLAASWPAHVSLAVFEQLDDLVVRLASLRALVSTDTGLYHLAAAMGIPATVCFGPTEPPNVILRHQIASRGIRLAVLGDSHCEVKTCLRPYCLDRAISNHAGLPCPTPFTEVPPLCPLRLFSVAALEQNAQWRQGETGI